MTSINPQNPKPEHTKKQDHKNPYHIENVAGSILNFFRSSFISIVLIVVLLLLLTKMSQAYTMLVAMIDCQKPLIGGSILLVSVLAMAISHYPIYVYYAMDLNDSREHVNWETTHFKIFNFKPINRLLEQLPVLFTMLTTVKDIKET